MKRLSLLFGIMLLIFLPQCKKVETLTKKKSLLFRTDIRLGKDYQLAGIKLLDSNIVNIVDTTDENIDCYYLMWNGTDQQEQVMRYNTEKDTNEIYGVVQGLQWILNLSEVFTQDKIYILGDHQRIYVFDIETRQTSTIDMPGMDFIAGVQDSAHIITIKWDDSLKQEQVYNVDNQGNAQLIGTIQGLQYILNFSVSLWDNKVYVLGGGNSKIDGRIIYIFDLDTKNTKTIPIEKADFIAGLYNDDIIVLSWNDGQKVEEVYKITPDGWERKLGNIDDLQWIINAAVTLVDDKVFVMGSNGSMTQRIYIYQL